jgi:hypothetical protein
LPQKQCSRWNPLEDRAAAHRQMQTGQEHQLARKEV